MYFCKFHAIHLSFLKNGYKNTTHSEEWVVLVQIFNFINFGLCDTNEIHGSSRNTYFSYFRIIIKWRSKYLTMPLHYCSVFTYYSYFLSMCFPCLPDSIFVEI